MSEQEKPKLAPELEVYGKTGGYFKKTDKEVDQTVKENREKKETEIAKKKVVEAIEKGEVKFGKEVEKVTKPTFEEYKIKQQAEQEEALKTAREKLEEQYEKAA